MERNNKPRLSIGLPVYNGEKYLSAAIDSILNQTYTDFELIISDNNSTDKTQAICQSYAQKDNRIKYYRLNENVGASKTSTTFSNYRLANILNGLQMMI